MSQSRLNREHDVPIILAAKAKRHRFTVFHGNRRQSSTERGELRSPKLFERNSTMTNVYKRETIMGAVEAREERRKRGLTTLEERLRQDPDVARRMDVHLDALRLEQQFVDAMRRRSITSADLARLVNRKPAGISRDLAGGLS